MLGGTFALLERSFRIEVRARSSHLIRLGVMLATYFCLCNAILTGMAFGAPGLRFFSSMIYLDVGLLTLTGIGFFATTITEEKEEDTLGLMLMAGISPLGILIGKSLGGLWQTMLLIAVQFPFILLSVTMGGVSRQQVWAATVALMAYVILLGGLGVLCSTVSKNSRAAVRLMCLGIGVYVFVPGIAMAYLLARLRLQTADGVNTVEFDLISRILSWVSDFSIFLQIGKVLTTSFDESAFSLQVLSNIVAGVFCGGLSWLAFGRATRNPSAEVLSRELVMRRTKWSLFSADRAWDNPFIWKDFHFTAGGKVGMLGRILLFLAIGLLPFLVECMQTTYGEWVWMSMFLMLFISSIAAASVLARSMFDEIRGQTLSSLMMLPTTPAHVVYSKYAGALLGLIPMVVVGPMSLLTSANFRKGLGELFRELGSIQNTEGVILGLLVTLLYGMFFVLIPHFAAILAMYVRWGAVPLAFGLAMGVYFIGGACVSSIAFAGMNSATQASIGVLLFICNAVLIGLCVGCHMNILLRAQTLAAK